MGWRCLPPRIKLLAFSVTLLEPPFACRVPVKRTLVLVDRWLFFVLRPCRGRQTGQPLDRLTKSPRKIRSDPGIRPFIFANGASLNVLHPTVRDRVVRERRFLLVLPFPTLSDVSRCPRLAAKSTFPPTRDSTVPCLRARITGRGCSSSCAPDRSCTYWDLSWPPPLDPLAERQWIGL